MLLEFLAYAQVAEPGAARMDSRLYETLIGQVAVRLQPIQQRIRQRFRRRVNGRGVRRLRFALLSREGQKLAPKFGATVLAL